ncbi:MAG: methyl-accepting chemotaxis protein [Verrucomicrobiota bacterium JB022]|nr:methyl-accepting chemotaxis protein [Verrucomicrobiota bacterium JB022]
MVKRFFGRLSLSQRLVYSVAFSTAVAFALSIAFLGYRSYSAARHNAQELAAQSGALYGAQLSAVLDDGLVVSQNMAHVLEGLMAGKAQLSREEVVATLARILEGNSELLATWVCFEPNAFDGQDEAFREVAPYHDSTGRFVPYVFRADGKISAEPLIDYTVEGAGDYYLKPLHEERQVVIEPYMYAVGGKEVFITSVCLPIHVDGKAVGVAGVDLNLSDISAQAAKLKPMDVGQVMMATPSGNLVGHPDFSKVGTPLDAASADGVMARVSDGERVFLTTELDGEPQIGVFMPLKLRGQPELWAMGVTIPSGVVLAEANRTLYWSVGIAIACILVLAGITTVIIASTVRGISRISSSLRAAASEVNSASHQVSAVGERQAESASEMAASLTQTSSSVEEFASMTRQNSDNASSAAHLMDDALKTLNNAGQNIVQLTTSMGEIKDASNQTQKIIKTIDEIAFQTNILALNAAVEAARAGEAGAGFAVVADEVRSLAQRASEASRSTSGLIEDAANKSQLGSRLVEAVSGDFDRIRQHVNEVGGLIGGIASASTEQARGADEINRAVAQASEATQSTAAVAEESSAAAHELQAQAASMRENIEALTLMILGRRDERGAKPSAPGAGAPKPGPAKAQPRQEEAREEELEIEEEAEKDPYSFFGGRS